MSTLQIEGKKFNRLTVIQKVGAKGKNSVYLCVCDCGAEVVLRKDHITSGNTKSCGCLKADYIEAVRKIKPEMLPTKSLQIEQHVPMPAVRQPRKPTEPKFKHTGWSKYPLYSVWSGMIQRCYNQKTDVFKHYGGRGIDVCSEWKEDFMAFYTDMYPRPEGTSLGRIDNNKGYSKENCRWETPEQQMGNTRRSVLYELNGETMSLIQWAEKLQCSIEEVVAMGPQLVL